VPLLGQFPGPVRLACLGVLNGRAGDAGRDCDREGRQEFGGSRPLLPARIAGMRCKRGELVGAPHVQRHRDQEFLELIVAGRGE
jgi:hypothetical protein